MNKSILSQNEMNSIGKKFIFESSAKVENGNTYFYRTNRGYDDIYVTITKIVTKYDDKFTISFGILPGDFFEFNFNVSYDDFDKTYLVKLIKQNISIIDKNLI